MKEAPKPGGRYPKKEEIVGGSGNKNGVRCLIMSMTPIAIVVMGRWYDCPIVGVLCFAFALGMYGDREREPVGACWRVLGCD
jgi:hypothetical protein